MFTGIIEETGTIKIISTTQLTISCQKVLEDISIGDSIAVNGICLTAVDFSGNSLTVDMMPVTREKSNLAFLAENDLVNLERAMSFGSRFGGHIVSGHVDSTGKILAISQNVNAVLITISIDPETAKYVIQEGSICIDGISLTIAKKMADSIIVSLIPHTYKVTNFASRSIGDIVNLEVDQIGKYVYNFINKKTKITKEFLSKHGF